jgi:6,7-dimethyl-8-ribityllumazine synthase
MANQVLKSRNDVKFIITLGCVIKGETAHFEYISGATSNALANLTIQNNVPILFGVITSYTRDQALARSQVNFNEVNNYNIGYNVTEAAFEIINSVSTLQNN